MTKNRDASQLAAEFELLPKTAQREILLSMQLNPEGVGAFADLIDKAQEYQAEDPRDITSVDPEVWATAFRNKTRNYDAAVDWFTQAMLRGSQEGERFARSSETLPRLATVLAAEHQEQYEHDAQFRSWIETLDGLLPLWVNGLAVDASNRSGDMRDMAKAHYQDRPPLTPDQTRTLLGLDVDHGDGNVW